MSRAQNGWPVLDPTEVRGWRVPGTNLVLPLAPGAGGFLLTHVAAWFSRDVEPLDGGQRDDWGYARRQIRGGSEWSNHAAGAAVDLNATRHPLGERGTFTPGQRQLIIERLHAGPYRVVRWGGEYVGRADEMHFELVGHPTAVARAANRLLCTPLGRQIRRENRGVPWSS